MDCTNCKENCSFVKSGFCETDRGCPFYLESWWLKDGDPEPKLIKDCFPKKFGVEQNRLLHRFLATQSVVEDVRNRMDRLENLLATLIDQSKEFLVERSQIPVKDTPESQPYKALNNEKMLNCIQRT